MARIVETEVIAARPAIDRTEVRFEGLNGSEPDYGKVHLVRIIKWEKVTDGDRHRVLDGGQSEQILATIDAAGAAHLARTLVTALAGSLQVREPRA